MDTLVAIGFVEAGRRHAVHRVVVVDGARHVATERCNLDGSASRADITEAAIRGPKCRWCFPKG